MLDASENQVNKWGAMNGENYKISIFVITMENVQLANNFSTNLGQLYATIEIFFRSANRQNVDILPELLELELSPSLMLHNAILPPQQFCKRRNQQVVQSTRLSTYGRLDVLFLRCFAEI